MNKKYLSALLFGALTLASTGTFTSCKDYDDDIEDLQGQIDKFATKEDLSSQIATLESALATAKTEAAAVKKSAEEALAKAGEAEKAAAKAAVDAAAAKEEAIKAAQAEVAKAKTELEATIDSKFEAAKAELAATVQELTAKVEKLTNLSTEMITSIDLQEGKGYDFTLDLNYSQIDPAKRWNKAKSYTFGKDLEGSFSVAAGEIFANPSSLLVSVAPANAALPGEILSIVDSEGVSVNDFINLTSESFTDKLYKDTRAVTNGLYKLTAELKKEADKDALAKLVTDKYTGNKVAFAVCASKEGRVVTSTYDLDVQSELIKLKEATDIDRNSTIKSSIAEEALLISFPGHKTGSTTVNDENCYPVAYSEAFTIKVASHADIFGGDQSKVMASYVVVDINNKALSTTDKAAIKGLEVSGDVNKVSKENEFDITIAGANAQGVVVPLKVVTLDYTGAEQSVVVWVKAGGTSEIAQTAAYVVTPNEFVATPTAYSYTGIQKFVVPATTAKYELSIVERDANRNDEIRIVETAAVLDGSNLQFYKDLNADGTAKTRATKNTEIAYAQLNATLNLQTLIDNKVYTGTVKFYNAEGTFLSQSTMTVQKVLPTAFPAGFSAKTNAIKDGVLTVYPKAESSSKNGIFALERAFNGLDKLPQIIFSSDDADLVGNAQKPANAKFDNNAYNINSINPNIIHNGKTYGAKVAYNYGDIRSAYKLADGTSSHNLSIDWATKFSIKFDCMVMASTYSWVTEPVVYYNENTLVEAFVTEGKTQKAVNVITVKDAYNADMNPFVNAENWSYWAEAIDEKTNVTLKTTNESGQVIDNEFFNAEFTKTKNNVWALQLTKVSTNVVLSGDVKTDVVITIVDKFGHEHEVPALSFTMKKEHPAK